VVIQSALAQGELLAHVALAKALYQQLEHVTLAEREAHEAFTPLFVRRLLHPAFS
jgi:hypothetical protein